MLEAAFRNMGNNEGAKYGFYRRVSLFLFVNAEDLEFIFQQVSHPEYTVRLTLQWFLVQDCEGTCETQAKPGLHFFVEEKNRREKKNWKSQN